MNWLFMIIFLNRFFFFEIYRKLIANFLWISLKWECILNFFKLNICRKFPLKFMVNFNREITGFLKISFPYKILIFLTFSQFPYKFTYDTLPQTWNFSTNYLTFSTNNYLITIHTPVIVYYCYNSLNSNHFILNLT